MIIDQINVEGLASLEPENDPPIGANGNGPVAFAITLQLMQPEGWQSQRLDRVRGMEHGQDLLDLADMLCVHAPGVKRKTTISSP